MNLLATFKTAIAHPEFEGVFNIDPRELATQLNLHALRALTSTTSATPFPAQASTSEAEPKPESQPAYQPEMTIHLIDVRMPQEFTDELGHIQNSRLIPLPVFAEHLSELPKDGAIVFVCKSGGRSAQASAFAKMNGFDHTYNMAGGMLKWNELLLPVER